MLYDLLQHSLDKGVAKSEGSCSEYICDGWVHFLIIFVVVSIGDWKNVKFSHEVCSKNYRQPLIVCYVLGG